MSIDLDTTEGRKKYLSEKLDDLLDGINDSYGTVLMDELIGRLELTIKDFNNEMKKLCDKLIEQEKDRQQLMEMLKSAESTKIASQSADSPNIQAPLQIIDENDIDEDIPEWEKKLAKLEKK